jgi:hypothetical protein
LDNESKYANCKTGLTSSVVNGIIYVIGGYNGAYLSTNEAYDPAENIEVNKISINTAIASSRSSPNTAGQISAGSDIVDLSVNRTTPNTPANIQSGSDPALIDISAGSDPYNISFG